MDFRQIRDQRGRKKIRPGLRVAESQTVRNRSVAGWVAVPELSTRSPDACAPTAARLDSSSSSASSQHRGMDRHSGALIPNRSVAEWIAVPERFHVHSSGIRVNIDSLTLDWGPRDSPRSDPGSDF